MKCIAGYDQPDNGKCPKCGNEWNEGCGRQKEMVKGLLQWREDVIYTNGLIQPDSLEKLKRMGY